MTDTFYKDHWVEIESDRFDRYLEMFKWSEANRPFLAPAKISQGEEVVEIGCGPGFLSCEMASWVGCTGKVDGLDINQQFIQHGKSLAIQQGLNDVVDFHLVGDAVLPFENGSKDCVIAKNVLLYVDDPEASFVEAYRVLNKNGRLHVVEGDWGLLFAEPVPTPLWDELIGAASIAFKTPLIGRKLFGLAKRSGFAHTSVSCEVNIDTTGRLLPMIENLCNYARASQVMEEKKITLVTDICKKAEESGDLLICSPQFLVTAYR